MTSFRRATAPGVATAVWLAITAPAAAQLADYQQIAPHGVPGGQINKTLQEQIGRGRGDELTPCGVDRRGLGLERRQRSTRPCAFLLRLPQAPHRGVVVLGGAVRRLGGVTREAERFGPVVRALRPAFDDIQTHTGRRSPRRRRLEVGRLVGGQQPLRFAEEKSRRPGRVGHVALRRSTALLEGVEIVLVGARAEQTPQQLLPVVVLRQEELGEAVLGKEDHLQELLLAEPQDLIELEPDVTRPAGASLPRSRRSAPRSCSS